MVRHRRVLETGGKAAKQFMTTFACSSVFYLFLLYRPNVERKRNIKDKKFKWGQREKKQDKSLGRNVRKGMERKRDKITKEKGGKNRKRKADKGDVRKKEMDN
jgi:hypothetical protein